MITRRRFGFGILAGIITFLIGSLFGACRRAEPEIDDDEHGASYWTPGDHLAG